MEIKQNPFSVYDFLGYFTPGALFLYGCLAASAHVSALESGVLQIATTLSFDKAEIYIPFVLCAYVIGHVIAYFSSTTIERYSIWAIGYPSKSLLGLTSAGYFDVKVQRRIHIPMRLMLAVVLLPISAIDAALYYLRGKRRPRSEELDPLLRAIVKKKLFSLLTTHGGLSNPPSAKSTRTHNFFLYAYHYAVENAPHHGPRMQNYVALYGFLRSLAFLALIAFWAVVAHIAGGSIAGVTAFVVVAGVSVLCYVLYQAFLKFYQRYSLEALMAMAVTCEAT